MENLEKILNQIKDNHRVKQRVAFEEPFWFSLLYLQHHFTYLLAPFQLEMLRLLKKPEYDFIAVMAFRESGKSTIMNLTNVLWSILGKPQKKFVIIVSKTQEQAKNHFLNIKAELENNETLKSDFGPFVENEDDMKRLSLELVYHGSKIMSVHIDQSIRGLKYGLHRPDLIICDDLEDTSVSNRKERDLLYNRFSKEIIPLGSGKTRVVILGNLLSENSLMMRLKDDIEKEKLIGIFRVYPLLDDYRNNLWQEKFKDLDAIKKLRTKLSTEAWVREYLLTFDDYFLEEMDDLKIDETNDQMISKWYHLKIAGLRNTYREKLKSDMPQKSLIYQMEKYVISAPNADSFIHPEKEELLHEVYQEYVEKEKKLIDELHQAFKRARRIRGLDQANKERTEIRLPPQDISSILTEEKHDPENMEKWDDDPEYTASEKLNEEISITQQKRKAKMERMKEAGYWDPERGNSVIY